VSRSTSVLVAEIKTLFGRRHEEKLQIQKDMAVLRDEHGWTQDQIAGETGVPKGTVDMWLRAYDEGLTDPSQASRLTPVSTQAASDRRVAKRVIAENPAVVMEAFEAATPEVRREIARQVSTAPEVQLEAQQRQAETNYRPTPVRQNDNLVLMQFESKLATADSALRKALGLLEKVDQEGDDDDILFRINQLRTLVEVVDETYRSGKSLDTWANELWQQAK
jgi:transcriptional regulator with XRE-family HTH domain